MQNYSVTVEFTKYDKDGNLIYDSGKEKNLVLDYGLELLSTTLMRDCMKVCSIGSGTTATNRPSQGLFMDKVGASVTTTLDFFTSDDALYNRVLQLSSGQVVRVVSFGTPQSVVVDTVEGSLTNGSGIIWNVEQTKLDTFTSNSEIYNNSKPTNNGQIITTPTVNGTKYVNIALFRTFQFDYGAGGGDDITEAGWSFSNADNPNLFGRIKLSTPITVGADERVLVKVTMNKRFDITDFVGNDPYFSADASFNVDKVLINEWGFAGINDDGSDKQDITTHPITPMLEPSATQLKVTIVNTSSVILSQFTPTVATYIPNSYTRNWAEYAISENFATSISRFEYGATKTLVDYDDIIVMQYSTAQVKPDEHNFKTTFNVTWNRDLPEFPA